MAGPGLGWLIALGLAAAAVKLGPTLILAAAVILPLALDTAAVSTAMGLTPMSARRRVGLGLLFAVFEGGMPAVGLLLGASIGTAIGALADYAAIAALAGLGIYTLAANEAKEQERLERFSGARGGALIGLGLSVSLDELAIGFSWGLAKVPLGQALILVAAQAFIVSQIGFRVGSQVGERVRDGAGRAAAIALIVIAVLLLVAKVTGH